MKILNWADIQPGTTVWVEEKAKDMYLYQPENYEILARTADDRLEIIWHLGLFGEAYHGFLTRNQNFRVWDEYPCIKDREEIPWN